MGWIETCFSFSLRFRHLFLWFATFSLYERISSSLVDSLLVRWAQLSLTVCCNEIPFGRPIIFSYLRHFVESALPLSVEVFCFAEFLIHLF